MTEQQELAFAQRDILVAQWDRDNRFGSKVDSFIVFPELSHLKDRAEKRNANVLELKGHVGDAYVYVHHDGVKELWVRAVDKATNVGSFSYTECWNSFALSCGINNPGSIGSDWQVDHVYPETSAARRHWGLVRTMPVMSKGNAGVGASLEASLADISPKDHKGGWIANWYTIAKITGFQGTFNKKLVDDMDLAKQIVAHVSFIYPELEILNPNRIDWETEKLAETIALTRGRIINVVGNNERLKDDFIAQWTQGFNAGVHGRANRVPKDWTDDARAAWKLGWAAGIAAPKQSSE